MVHVPYTEAMLRKPAAAVPEPRIFLLSPATCRGLRASLLTSSRATFPLATRLRSPVGAPLGEVFSFLSGLYFRGKLTYARAFARPPDPGCAITGGGVFVITPDAGLKRPETSLTVAALHAAARVDIDAANRRYRRPLESTSRAVADRISRECRVVLLGSIASRKYVDVLTGIFGERLQFPVDFVGRGDMSRGGLLLRSVAQARELEYASVHGAVLHGARPPKLAPLPRRPGAIPD
jgi:hypothetical protein